MRVRHLSATYLPDGPAMTSNKTTRSAAAKKSAAAGAKPNSKAKAQAKTQAKASAKASAKAQTNSKAKTKANSKSQQGPVLGDAELKLRVVQMAMEIAGDEGWAAVNSADVAQRLRVPQARVNEVMPDKHDILRHLGQLVDEQMQAGGIADGDLRDRLFDVIMRRFDALQPYRPGVKAAVAAMASDISLPLVLLGRFDETLELTLQTADVEPTALRKAGFATLMLLALRTWLQDETLDQSKTMAELDRRIRQLDELAHTLAPFFGKK